MLRKYLALPSLMFVALALGAPAVPAAETKDCGAGYKPTKEELSTVADPTSGLSQAAVCSLKARGFNSSWQLVKWVESQQTPPAQGKQTKALKRKAVEEALAKMQPPLDPNVEKELARYVFKYHKIGEENL